MLTTSETLLRDLRGADSPTAWDRFVHLYSSGLYSWIRSMGFQHADAADLVQDVFVTLVQKLPEFEYERGRTFRGWLWTLTRNKCRTSLRGRRPTPVVPESLSEWPADDDEPFWEEEFRQQLVARVVPLLEKDFPPAVWKAFWAHVVEEKPASAVAAELGVNMWSVYTAKVRVLAHLHKELADLAAP